jgi:hypothetical protein
VTPTIDKILYFLLETAKRYQANTTAEEFMKAREYLQAVKITDYLNADDVLCEYGICVSCSRPSRLFSIPATLVELMGGYADTNYRSKICRTCAVQHLRWQIGNTSNLAFTGSDRFTTLLDEFFGEATKHLVITPRDNCHACNRAILNYTPNASAVWTGVNAYNDLKRTELVLVHRKCFFTCDSGMGCGGEFVRNPNTDCQSIHGEYTLCASCFENYTENQDGTNCAECGSWFLDGDLVYSNYHDSSFCTQCFDNIWYQCDDCGEEYQGENRHECRRSRYDERIHEYGHKPRAKFFGEAPYYFGIELEVEQTDYDLGVSEGVDIILDTYNLGNRIYLKEDGSLENGFEIVTHPHSLDEFQKSVNWGFLSELSNSNFRSWDTGTCGFHVHISRSAFDDDNHLIRFTKLIYDNKNAVRTLAGRSSDYARFNDSAKEGGAGLIRKIKNGVTSDGHFGAVSTQTYDEKTVEVRVFRGSLRKERVLANIEFCHAVVEHTRNMKISPKDRPMSWTKFISFIGTNSVRYPNLNLIIDQTLNVYRQPTTAELREEVSS